MSCLAHISSDHLLEDQQLLDHYHTKNRPKMSLENFVEVESEIITINCDCNTFIFNWVLNYDRQVNILKEAMESQQNKVQIFNNLTEKALLNVVEQLSRTNFELFNYICIIILDNQCPYEQFIQTSDKINVLLESEILTKIKTNIYLTNVKRLFVIQKLLDIRDIDDEELDKINDMIKERKSKVNLGRTLSYGLSQTLKACEYERNYLDSPFLEVFSQKFRHHAKTMKINEIFNDIRREIKELRYDINIENGGNELPTCDLIYGDCFKTNVLRDFF
ncbi:uncharacterized protein LOC119606511 [Lucilia sericata]|uniref:uncharacterized protein LOC119606511 n=1 Tax=Lucilia sericata TaxID=13632 RepID=UPI0018A87962|nr:uncharacterized protein LOC119606511 [Lucilia sericata]